MVALVEVVEVATRDIQCNDSKWTSLFVLLEEVVEEVVLVVDVVDVVEVVVVDVVVVVVVLVVELDVVVVLVVVVRRSLYLSVHIITDLQTLISTNPRTVHSPSTYMVTKMLRATLANSAPIINPFRHHFHKNAWEDLFNFVSSGSFFCCVSTSKSHLEVLAGMISDQSYKKFQ